MEDEQSKTMQFKFLSLLIQKGPMSIGEDMYRLGDELGFNEQLVRDIVNYYHEHNVIQFPVLGPYIRLVYDWYHSLNDGDRILLKEGFLLNLEELHRKNMYSGVTAREVFDLMGYGAFSETLVPAIVESLVLDGYIKKVNNHVILTEQGKQMYSEIKDRKKREHQETLKRLGVI